LWPAACGSTPASPSSQATRVGATVETFPGEVGAVHPVEDVLLLEIGFVTTYDVEIRPWTTFSGDAADMAELRALNRQGYHLHLVAEAWWEAGPHVLAPLSVHVSKSGPQLVHFRRRAEYVTTWMGLPAVHQAKSSVRLPGWVTVRADSEIRSIDALVQAVQDREEVCVAGDGMSLHGDGTIQATRIGAWHALDCDGR